MTGPKASPPLVLVVGDDPPVRRFLVSTLVAHGFRSRHAGTRAAVRSEDAAQDPDLVILDAGHRGVDGVGLTSRLRAATTAPIVAVLNPSREEERARVLDAGADDYLVKPFGTGDLTARVRVWVRQSANGKGRRAPVTKTPHLQIDRDRHCVLVDGREVHITPLQFRLLDALARTRVATSEPKILRAVWGHGEVPPAHYLRAHLRQLRLKIEKDPSHPRHLLGEPGAGYRLRLG
jgi:two-component system, OmpR family, KDP operon response regulator KdpE